MEMRKHTKTSSSRGGAKAKQHKMVPTAFPCRIASHASIHFQAAKLSHLFARFYANSAATSRDGSLSLNALERRLQDELCTRRGSKMSIEEERRALLLSRMQNLPLCRARVGQSQVSDGGYGLFAMQALSPGQLITLYPADWLLTSHEGNIEVSFVGHTCVNPSATRWMLPRWQLGSMKSRFKWMIVSYTSSEAHKPLMMPPISAT